MLETKDIAEDIKEQIQNPGLGLIQDISPDFTINDKIIPIHLINNSTNIDYFVSKKDITEMMDLAQNIEVGEKDQITKDKLIKMIDALTKTFF